MTKFSQHPGSIGIFDSGYGGLTILNGIRKLLPQYDYIYLGDNARAPYGNRSFEIVYEFTRQAVVYLFEQGCQLIVIGCNTASAKALRSIQMNDLPQWDSQRRVLGVIRPTAEQIGYITKSRHIGILATIGTINSGSYPMEVKKLFPDITVVGQACPMWVPLIENNEAKNEGSDYFVKKYLDMLLDKDPAIDTVILGCTHYPLLYAKIRAYLPGNIQIVSQGDIVSNSLKDYLHRHSDMDDRCTKSGKCIYCTTESEDKFKDSATIFLNEPIQCVQRVSLE